MTSRKATSTSFATLAPGMRSVAPAASGLSGLVPAWTLDGFDAYLAAHPGEREALTSPYTVVKRQGDKLVVNAPNCIDCKATDAIGPRWTPREGGSGPKYRLM